METVTFAMSILWYDEEEGYFPMEGGMVLHPAVMDVVALTRLVDFFNEFALELSKNDEADNCVIGLFFSDELSSQSGIYHYGKKMTNEWVQPFIENWMEQLVF
jgi:hypothetical protein